MEKLHCGGCRTGGAVPLSCGAEDTLCGPFAVRGSTGVGGFIVNCIRKKLWFRDQAKRDIERGFEFVPIALL